MKLGDIRGERVLDVIADLVQPVASIAKDKDVSSTVRKAMEGGDSTDALLAVVPVLLKGHRADVIAILATIAGETPEEYAADMTLASLIRDAVELLSDREFASFLASSDATSA